MWKITLFKLRSFNRTYFSFSFLYNSNLDKCHYTGTMRRHGWYKMPSHHPRCSFSTSRRLHVTHRRGAPLNHVGSFIQVFKNKATAYAVLFFAQHKSITFLRWTYFLYMIGARSIYYS